MSDEEEYTDEEVEEEIEEEEEVAVAPVPEEVSKNETPAPEPETEKTPQLRRAPPKQEEPQGESSNLTEAEIAMLAAKKRFEEESEAKAKDSEARRRQELADVETELEELKQRVAERKKQREVEEAEFAQRRREDDERRRKEEEERKARVEEQKRAKEEEKLKRQQIMAGGFVTSSVGNKRSSKTAEQHAEAKRTYLASLQKPDVSGLLPNDLKVKIKQLHQRILKLEAEKYDLEKRHERQDYDLKELTERQSQHARNKALAAGVEVEEAEGRTLPPKINVSSKFDRQKDSRPYGEKRSIFENPPVEQPQPIAHGSGRPPAEWRPSKQLEELEVIRKNLEPPKYVEIVKAEGDAARPPVDPVPMQLPTEQTS